jgi:NAD(P)-dependent dehydrogenase (short-subunit alcohol dehydrogenase family)
MPLTNKVAVIVGATGQLGPAIAKAFAHEGAKLVLVGTQESDLLALQKDLGFRDTRVMVQVADPASDADMQALAETVIGKFDRADILLHIAGGYRSGTLQDTPDDVWDYMLNLNLRTAVNAIRAFLPHLSKNGWGRILTISSGITQAPPANAAAYVTAKAAVETMTIAVAQEVKDKNITANVVLIRALDTPTERAKQPDKKTGWVKPDDVAATLRFLCSDEGGAISGARIPVFGGN